MTARPVMIQQTCIMLSMQNDINSHVDADWLARDRAWYRAIWIECAELMDHYGGWKWWKHSTPDYPQVLLEIVDIWHFGLSLRIDPQHDYERGAERIVAEWLTAEPAGEFLGEVERLATAALTERRFDVAAVSNLLAACCFDFDALYRHYVAKNVLNVFRQDHGYRSGTYRKIWNEREDNVVLAELLTTLDSSAPDFREAVYAALAGQYPGSRAAP